MNNDVPTLDAITKAIAPPLRDGGADRAFVFGSYARGEADHASDLDLIVVAATARPFIERFKDFAGVWRASPVKSIDMFVYTPHEFEAMLADEDSLVSRALREGSMIFEAGPDRPGGALAAPGPQRSRRR